MRALSLALTRVDTTARADLGSIWFARFFPLKIFNSLTRRKVGCASPVGGVFTMMTTSPRGTGGGAGALCAHAGQPGAVVHLRADRL
jgi:hypothetical protein